MLKLDHLLSEEIRGSFIFNIPHSGTLIPDYTGYNMELIDTEIKLVTDFNTDEIFYVDGVDRVVTPFSRIFCDVERMTDSEEIMFKSGAGFYYTHTDDGQILRDDIPGVKRRIWNEYYIKFQKYFTELVNEKLEENGIANIVDCHSFPDTPFNRDIAQGKSQPDICIGTDTVHTPDYLLHAVTNSCDKYGLTYDINSPYEGTFVPIDHFDDASVNSIMIEVNRKLYMDDGIVNYNKIKYLREFVTDIIPGL